MDQPHSTERPPEIAGQPTFGPDGLTWHTEDGWTVVVMTDEAGRPAAHWCAPNGHPVIGYAPNIDGSRTAALSVEDGDPERVRGWPAAA